MNTLSLIFMWLSKDPFLHVIWLTNRDLHRPWVLGGRLLVVELFIHMIESASARGKLASVLPFASAHRSVTPFSKGSVQDKAQNCYTRESSKKSLPELSRNLISNRAGNWLQPVTAQVLWLLLRSSCGFSWAWLASHEQCTTLLSSLLWQKRKEFNLGMGLFPWLWVWVIPLWIKYFWDTYSWFSHLFSTQGRVMLAHCKFLCWEGINDNHR